MSYFRNFPTVLYKFGNETDETLMRNLTVFADVVDQVKDQITVYQDYYIQENERPDQVSFKLYDTPYFYWTFYMMNDKIRECGWPLTNQQLFTKVKKDLPNTTLTTRSVLHDKFKIGQTITGSSSGITAKVIHRHIDVGQLVVTDITGTFTNGELITSVNDDGVTESITLHSSELQYLSALHYKDGNGVITDIDPTVGPGALLTEVTYFDKYIESNDDKKQIRILRPNLIRQVVQAHQESLKL